ncbi:MAG: hypothetical protein KGI40_07295 [Xanthomonadaceae bacterium]|nr:hypothetical protein [Xanthomonadaceae bacterium]MDE1958872.1 hypothetical protein [Xanthomonadaceae bacterium]MDE2178595.1 hypothetical protein [Xanthomonadaceae bacterium]MDE2246149.1 hypothetical protein [Xanthomonadaceae bacterium]
MQITKLAASLAAVLITASLLAGVRSGFEGTTVMSASSPRVPTTAATRTTRAEQARADSRSGAGSAITMPYYSYGASLPTFLKD